MSEKGGVGVATTGSIAAATDCGQWEGWDEFKDRLQLDWLCRLVRDDADTCGSTSGGQTQHRFGIDRLPSKLNKGIREHRQPPRYRKCIR